MLLVNRGKSGGNTIGNLVVSEDGEILTTIEPGDRILRKKSVEHLKELQEWNISHFYKGNIDENRKQLEFLSVYERSFLYTIATYIGYEDCCIKHDNGKPLNFDTLVSLSGMARKKCSEVINSLIKKDILYKGRNSSGLQYFVNPWMFSKGKNIQRVLKTMFRNYKVRVRNNQRWGDLED